MSGMARLKNRGLKRVTCLLAEKKNEFKFYNHVMCPKCGMKWRRYVKTEQEQISGNIVEPCVTCERRSNNDFHKLKRERAEELEQKFKSISCDLDGTCNILKAHHAVLLDDPERLTTEFCINLVCGSNGVEKYKKSRGLS